MERTLQTRWFLGWTLMVLWSGVTVFNASIVTEGIAAWLLQAMAWSMVPLLVVFIHENPEKLQRLPRIAAISGLLHLLFFAISVVETSDGVSWLTLILSPDYRHGGLAGNKNFLSEVLLLNTLLILPGLRDHRFIWRWIILVTLFLTVLALIVLKTLAVWIAIVLVGFFLIQQLLQSNNFSAARSRWLVRFLFIVIGLLVVGASLFSVPRGKQIVQQLERPVTISSCDSLNNNSTYERKLMWRNSWRLIEDQPMVGVGLSDWKIEQMRYGIGGTSYLNSGMARFEHPHNEYLLLWTEQGMVGLLLFMVFFVLVAFSGTAPSPSSELSMHFCSRLALIGVLVISCFAYPLHGELTLSLVMIHLAIYLATKNEQQQSPRWMPAKVFLWMALMLSVFSLFVFSKRWVGETHRSRSMSAQLQKKYSISRREALKSRSDWYILDPTGTPVNWYIADAFFREGNIGASIPYFEKALKENPYHLRVLNDYGTACEQLGKTGQAIELYTTALVYCPLFLEAQFNLAAAYHNAGKSHEAVDVLYSLQNQSSMTQGNLRRFRQYVPVIMRGFAVGDSLKVEPGEERANYLRQLFADSVLLAEFNKSTSPESFLFNMKSRGKLTNQ